MAKYIPMIDYTQRADSKSIIFKYYQAAGAERIVIESYWKVDLSNLENIEPQATVPMHLVAFYEELYVETGVVAGDHPWQESVESKICGDKEYDPAVVTDLRTKQTIIRNKILSLLALSGTTFFEVKANVTQLNLATGNQSSNTISGSGDIEII